MNVDPSQISSTAAAATVDAFSVFTAAAEPEHSDDIFDRIEVFVRRSIAYIDEVSRISAAFAKDEKTVLFAPFCNAADMRIALWEHVCLEIRQKYLAPKKVTVADVPLFIARALGWKPSRCSAWDSRRESPLAGGEIVSAFLASPVRAAFEREIGDPRERRIAELRQAAFRVIGSSEPANPKWLLRVTRIHDVSYTSRFLMKRAVCSGADDVLTVLRYVIHIATGTDPADTTVPPVFGLTDGRVTWERSALLSRHLAPCPGVEWLRYTADSDIEMRLDARVFSILLQQWREFQRAKALAADARAHAQRQTGY